MLRWFLSVPYIEFNNGQKIENPFYVEKQIQDFVNDRISSESQPAKPAPLVQSLHSLVDEIDPGGFGTSCSSYQGEGDMVMTLVSQYQLNLNQAILCLDILNTAGIVVGTVLTDKDIKENIFLDRLDMLDIEHRERLMYTRVIRDTLRAIRSGKINSNPYEVSIRYERERNIFFTEIVRDCVRMYK